MHILIINGPNLNLLGTREPEIYGSATLRDLESDWVRHAQDRGSSIDTFQSNHEGAIIDAIHGARGVADGIVINPGAYTHTSRAIPDAIAGVGIPTVEVHLSDIMNREPWRAISHVAEVSLTTIHGRGATGYLNAIDALVAHTIAPATLHHYGEEDHQVADVRVPEGIEAPPVAVLIHGGYWRSYWKRDTLDLMAAALVKEGMATVNLEYAVGGDSYPAAIEDVEAALAWVTSHGDELGLDGSDIRLVGHSAGGYVALKVAERSADLTRVVAIAPVTDIDAVPGQFGEGDPASAFLGGTEAERPDDWSSARLVGTPQSPVVIVHGSEDTDVPDAHARWYVERAEDAVHFEDIEGSEHFAPIDPTTEAGAIVVGHITA